MKVIIGLIITFIVSTSLSACGQMGPLYNPDDQAAQAIYDPGADHTATFKKSTPAPSKTAATNNMQTSSNVSTSNKATQ